VEETQLSQAETQKLWNEEAAKLDVGESSPAFEAQSIAPETPQESEIQIASQPESVADPLAGLPEEVKQALGKITQLEQANSQLLHHLKTTEGRVAAMQREAQQARQAATQDAPTQTAIASAAKNPEKWEQLKQDFPEWAGAMEEYVGVKLSNMQQPNAVQATHVVDYVQAQLATEREQMRTLLEEARVEGKYEDWRDTVNTPDFAQWLAIQPNEVRALADSTAARDAIKMLDMFHNVKGRSSVDIRQERSQRLAAAATTRPGQTPPPKTLDDLSPEELWNYEASQREKTKAQRGY